jgi:hypothetical protein
MASRLRRCVVRASSVLLLTAGLAACAQTGSSSVSSSDTTAPSTPLTVEAPTPTQPAARELSPLPTVP